MAQELDIDTRLADEVTSLSTKLVTEVAKSSRLEETILQLRREHTQMKTRFLELETVEKKYQSASQELASLKDTHEQIVAQKQAAEAKNKQLEGEVEDLTASLFNEANEMVSNASREAYNFKLKNRKLIEELAEKDSIIASLQAQLHDLKELFVKMEDQQRSASRTNTPHVEKGRFDFGQDSSAPDHVDSPSNAVLQQLLYGVRARAVRFDLPAYQLDFKAFVYQLIKPDFGFDLASLKTLKYFRKLWTEELEPCIPVIPFLTGNTFMNRWSKGKSFWGLLAEGKAIIEPVAGVNETFKLTYKGAKRGNEVPVALKDACAFCGEQKDDLLEHARLYNLKLYGPATETGASASSASTITEIGGEPHSVVGTYPLCNFCLVKLRAICTFFARLRVVHSNIYKLEQNSSFDDIAYVNSFQFKRSSESLQPPSSDPSAEPIFVKLYLMILVLRAKIFWSRTGFWDTDEDVEFLNLDEIPIDTFRAVVQDNVAFKSQDQEVTPQVVQQESFAVKETNTNIEEASKSGPQRKKPVEDHAEKAAEKEISGLTEEDTLKLQQTTEAIETTETIETIEATEATEITETSAEPVTKKISVPVQETVSDPVIEKTTEPIKETVPQEPKIVAETPESVATEETKTQQAVSKGKKNKKKASKSKKNDSAPTEKATESGELLPGAPVAAEVTTTDQDEDAGEIEFQDSVEDFDQPPLQRRKSKSKEFKEKINKDLDNTLAALQESLE